MTIDIMNQINWDAIRDLPDDLYQIALMSSDADQIQGCNLAHQFFADYRHLAVYHPDTHQPFIGAWDIADTGRF